MNFAKDFTLHIESKLDYLISCLGPLITWQLLAPVPVTGSEPPRWDCVAQSQPKLQGTAPAHQQQPSMMMMMTMTTTTTTATTTTSLMIEGPTVNYRLGNVAAIWEEYQNFKQE
ncbi:hypothetical protein BGZ74_003457 [Mortierella antarctica]|nr:hypothetical protein BGZ74_003457 [Mortierella antarctica]